MTTKRGSPREPGLSAALVKSEQSELKKLIAEAVEEGNKKFAAQMNLLEKTVSELRKEFDVQKLKMATAEEEISATADVVAKVCKQQFLHENQLITLAWQSSQQSLRLQNVIEKEEELRATVTRILAPLVDLKEPQLLLELESVYRVETQYTKRNGLPKEIHIRLAKKCLRDMILYKANQGPVDYEGKQIRILKNIPYIIRKRRTCFRDFTKQLIQKKISFRWLLPQGLTFDFKGCTIKLLSQEQMERFMEKYSTEFVFPKGPPESSAKGRPEKGQGRETQTKKMELRPKKK